MKLLFAILFVSFTMTLSAFAEASAPIVASPGCKCLAPTGSSVNKPCDSSCNGMCKGFDPDGQQAQWGCSGTTVITSGSTRIEVSSVQTAPSQPQSKNAGVGSGPGDY